MATSIITLLDDFTWKYIKDELPSDPPPIPLPEKYTANEKVVPYDGFRFGSQGWFAGWTDQQLAKLQTDLGCTTMRLSLRGKHLGDYGLEVEKADFEYYDANGLKELTCFVGFPHEKDRAPKLEGALYQSEAFKGFYEPIFQADGTVNPANLYAVYLANLIRVYGKYIKFYEVFNEPDLTGDEAPWLTRPPELKEIYKWNDTIFSYIRMLRITWEIVKKLAPDSYVCTGGIGYANFLDCILRYTDNPDGGKVATGFELTGGAYFDVLSYHVYPHYKLRKYTASGFVNTSSSDAAVEGFIGHKTMMQTTLSKYGYDGNKFPLKHFICTETGLSKRSVSPVVMSDEMQRNFGIKSIVAAQKNEIKHFHFYALGDLIDAPAVGTNIVDSQADKLMGFYENLSRDKPGLQKITQLGMAIGTYGLLTAGYKYDPNKQLPAGAMGAAFVKDGKYLYILWSKSVVAKENTSATITIPAATRYEWDYFTTRKSVNVSGSVELTGSPSFFVVN